MTYKIGRPSNDFGKLSTSALKTKLSKDNVILSSFLSSTDRNYFPEYRDDPVGYTSEILGTYLWRKQKMIAERLVEKRKVLVRSSHLTGKSFLCANLALWVWDTHRPLSGIITGPTEALVKDVVFAEMRKLAKPHHKFPGSAAPVLEDSKDHVIRGVVTSDATSMHGRHSQNVFLLVDEATGVDADKWEAMESLFAANAYWLAVFNPTDATAYVHSLETSGDWDLITISAMEHPNIVFSIANPDDPRVVIPGCITLPRLRNLVKQWSEVISVKEKISTDILIPEPNGDPVWYRPGPICESRLLGRWPKQSYDSIWSDTLIEQIFGLELEPNYKKDKIQVGLDVARFGSDFTAIAAKCGPVAIHLSEKNGLSVVEVANLTKIIVSELSDKGGVDPKDIPINIDVNGIGSGPHDILYDDGYNVIGVDVNHRSNEPEKYHRLRCELWFNLAEKAMHNEVSLFHIPNDLKNKLKLELLSPRYTITNKGQFLVESKEKTKKRTRLSSPNLADALNLCYYEGAQEAITVSVTTTTG